MLDIQFIRDNAELVKEKSKQKGIEVDIDKLLELDETRRKLIGEVEDLRAKRNELSGDKKPSDEQIAKGKELKEKISKLEEELKKAEQFSETLKDIPNIFPDDTPLGGEEANKVEKSWGEPSKDKTIGHLEWGEKQGLIDFERGAKVAGNKFYYLKGQLVEIELALLQFALEISKKHSFTPMAVPHLVNTKVMSGTGFLPRGEEKQIYKIEGEDLNLIATSEISITGYHADEIIKGLPILYAGISPAYRSEAGAYGKHSKGLYRVHQFNKVELYVFCESSDSEKWHKKLLEIEEEICQALKIPYQVVRIAAGDLGAPAYKKYDIEYWSPAEQAFRELMSCSNVTDYQARRLNIRYKNKDGLNELVHTLNATATATSRMLIALIENFQCKNDELEVPEVLKPYLSRNNQ